MADYSIPSWLSPRESPTASYLQAFQTGAQIQEANNRLAAAERQNAMEHQARQEQIQANLLRQIIESNVQKAYNDQRIQLDKQKLEAAAAKTAQDFSDKLAFSKAVQAGADPAKEIMKYPSLLSSGVMNAAVRAAVPKQDKYVHAGQGVYRIGPEGKPETVIAPPKTIDPFVRMKYQRTLADISKLKAALQNPNVDPADRPMLQLQLSELQRVSEQIEQANAGQLDAGVEPPQYEPELGDDEELGNAPAVPPQPPAVAPKPSARVKSSTTYPDAPKDPKQRKAGQIYRTPKGPFIWDGEGWVSPDATGD